MHISKSIPPSDARELPDGLIRAEKLKKWSSELVEILKSEENTIFEGWGFEDKRLTKSDFSRIFTKITGCGSVIEMRSAIDGKTGEICPPVLHAGNFCNQHTICPLCAGRTQDRRGRKWKAPIQWAVDAFPYAYMVTATTAPAETWREDLDGLRGAWRRFQVKGQKGRRGEWGKVAAGLAKVELKRGKGSGLPHCHYHAILFTHTPMDYRLWTREEKQKPIEERASLYTIVYQGKKIAASKASHEWWLASGKKSINLDIRPLRGSPESIYRQCREVLKYATKFDSAPRKNQIRLFAKDYLNIKESTYGRRLFCAYGAFRVNNNDPEKMCPCLDHAEGGVQSPQMRDGPEILETRWRKTGYTELRSRPRPVFLGTDRTLANQYRWTVLNRLQGQNRRMRNAVIKARDHYRETGFVQDAEFMSVTYSEDWKERREKKSIQPPDYVLENPSGYSTWESWVDSITESGAEVYRNIREIINMDLRDRWEGTLSDRRNAELREVDIYRRGDEYRKAVTRAFVEIASAPGKMIIHPP